MTPARRDPCAGVHSSSEAAARPGLDPSGDSASALATASRPTHDQAVRLSICIITFNEEENLPRCLASIAGLARQVVVVDSGSEDRTVEIARGSGAEVIRHPFAGHVRQKQLALEQAREEWVLSLDADEWLEDRLREAIRAVLAGRPDPAVAGYELSRRNQYLGGWIDHCGWSPEWRLRLVRRTLAQWTGSDPHDRLAVDGRVERLRGRLCHRPYRNLAEHVGKINRYTDTMAARSRAEGVRPSLLALAFRPPARFLRMFVFRAGFLDGWRGLLVSALGAWYVFLKQAKLWESEHTAESNPKE
jgi:glycosyltransferase involved in cell wall biosynthesis